MAKRVFSVCFRFCFVLSCLVLGVLFCFFVQGAIIVVVGTPPVRVAHKAPSLGATLRISASSHYSFGLCLRAYVLYLGLFCAYVAVCVLRYQKNLRLMFCSGNVQKISRWTNGNCFLPSCISTYKKFNKNALLLDNGGNLDVIETL